MTYSIVARDPATGAMGVAVQSHAFSCGSIVTWGEAGVGVVATQATVDVSYGPLGLEAMGAGQPATAALAALLAVDSDADVRQVAFLDATGATAVHTGGTCIPAAGHRARADLSCQANMMLRDTVPDAMVAAYDSADGDLAERLVAALDAAEGERGDLRGRQSAALLVVGGAIARHAGDGRLLELRVEDHPEPLVELRRLLEVKRAYDRMDRASLDLSGDVVAASAEYQRAQEVLGGNVEPTFWHCVHLASAGRLDQARALLPRLEADTGEWVELLRRLPAAALLPAGVVEQLLS